MIEGEKSSENTKINHNHVTSRHSRGLVAVGAFCRKIDTKEEIFGKFLTFGPSNKKVLDSEK